MLNMSSSRILVDLGADVYSFPSLSELLRYSVEASYMGLYGYIGEVWTIRLSCCSYVINVVKRSTWFLTTNNLECTCKQYIKLIDPVHQKYKLSTRKYLEPAFILDFLYNAFFILHNTHVRYIQNYIRVTISRLYLKMSLYVWN